MHCIRINTLFPTAQRWCSQQTCLNNQQHQDFILPKLLRCQYRPNGIRQYLFGHFLLHTNQFIHKGGQYIRKRRNKLCLRFWWHKSREHICCIWRNWRSFSNLFAYIWETQGIAYNISILSCYTNLILLFYPYKLHIKISWRFWAFYHKKFTEKLIFWQRTTKKSENSSNH